MIALRRATTKDMPLLLQLRETVLREVFALEETADLSSILLHNYTYYLASLPTGQHMAYLAYCKHGLVGCGSVCFQQELPSPDCTNGKSALFMNIYTFPAFRGKGVGKAVMKKLIQTAKEAGAEKLYLETTEAGKKLYQKFGFFPMDGYLLYPKHTEQK